MTTEEQMEKIKAISISRQIEKQLITAVCDLYIRGIIKCKKLEKLTENIRKLIKEIIEYQENIKID